MSNQERALREGIDQYFAEFGPTACGTIYDAILHHRGVGPVLLKVGLTIPTTSDAQYQALMEYLRKHGVDSFAQAMSRRAVAAASPAGSSTSRRASDSTYKRVRAKPMKSDGAAEKPATLNPGESLPLPGETKPVKPRREPTPSPSDTSEARQSSAGLPMPRHGANYDPVADAIQQSRARKARTPAKSGKWDGVTERRSGRDRRTGEDRRSKVATCDPDTNKRYGGERRSGIDRRRS